MSSVLRFSKLFVRDVEEVLAHTATRFGPHKLEQYKAALRDALVTLAADEKAMGSRDRKEVGPGVRTLHLSRSGHKTRHLVLYQIRGDGVIRLGRLLHDSMELSNHLPPEFEDK